MFDPERQWNRIDKSSLFGFLGYRVEDLGLAILRLKERLGGQGQDSVGDEPANKSGENRQVGMKSDPIQPTDPEGE